MTADPQILAHIGELVEEEAKLRNRHERRQIGAEERRRLEQIEIELDQCWDLLNQRRAKREYGMDPEDAAVRDPETVEGYEQ